jgi:hypothetical protein
MNKIPVRQTIAEAYRFTFVGLEKVIGLIWLPTVILTVGSYFVMSPYLAGMAQAIETNDFAQQGPQLALMFGFEVACLVLMAMIGVAITREILNPLKRPLFLRFGLGGTEFRLVGALVGLYVLLLLFVILCVIAAVALGFVLNAVLPGAASLASAPGATRGLGMAALIGLCLSPVLFYLMARLAFLVVPCIVMEGKFGIERSWQLTKGNVWRIIGICFAIMLPILIVSMIGQVVILGPEYFNPHLELVKDQAAQAKHNVENLRLLASKLPLLVGFSFLLAPFTSGLGFSAPAFAYRALMAQEKRPE